MYPNATRAVLRFAANMRILHLMQCTNLGGMEQATLQRIRGLTELGHQCRVLSLNPLGALGPLLEEYEIPAEGLTYRGRGGWRSLPELQRKLRKESFDALHMTGHNWMATLALGDLVANRRLLSIHFHHTGVMPRWQWRIIYKSACSRFQAIAFPTEFIRNEAEEIFPPVAKIAVTLPYPFTVPLLPTKAERAQSRSEMGLPENAFIMGNAGWLIQRKRFDVFLKVAKSLADCGTPLLCIIAGDGPMKTELQSLSAELKIADKVRWLGWQNDLKKFYLSLDALVFNSDWDALGRTPLEALALGTPVVASVLQGGLSEFISSDEYGFLTHDHDVDWMRSRLLQIRDDPSLSNSIVFRARARMTDYCCPERDAKRLAALLNLQ